MAFAKGSAKPDIKTEVENRYTAAISGNIPINANDGFFEVQINCPFRPDEMIVRQASLIWQNAGSYYNIICPMLTTNQTLCLVADSKTQPANMQNVHLMKSEVRGLYKFQVISATGVPLQNTVNAVLVCLVVEFIRHPR
jgi:hypothetical protein